MCPGGTNRLPLVLVPLGTGSFIILTKSFLKDKERIRGRIEIEETLFFLTTLSHSPQYEVRVQHDRTSFVLVARGT